MIREFHTIQEVAGPLMLVKQVVGVTYGELGEIELQNGELRRCKVLEVNGTNVLVQLFESSAGINLSKSKVRFWGRSLEFGVFRKNRLRTVNSELFTFAQCAPTRIPLAWEDLQPYTPLLPVRRGKAYRWFSDRSLSV
ncbi:MAG: hypothetical protein HGB17_11515 [Syntrophobacteraceae bacterium]|nr:hypothetical protein [Syntrophobacteraceae bacterium]